MSTPADDLKKRQIDVLDRMDSVLAAFEEHAEDHALEHRWVKMAIQKEAQSIALRQAIIEKSLGSLVWAGLCFVGFLIWNYVISAKSN